MTRRSAPRFLALGLLALLPGCKGPGSRAGSADLGAPPPASAQPAARSPLPQATLPTTSGEIALGNLRGMLELHEGRLVSEPGRVASIETLIDIHLTRAHYLGQIASYERAARLADDLVRLRPREAGSYLLRTQVRSALHLFTEAETDLSRAEQLGASASEVAALRAGILTGLSRLDEALALRVELARAAPSLSSLASLAALRAARGEIAEAEALFEKAQHERRDLSPFPLAWLYFQQGLMWEEHGRPGRASELFQAALDRLPGYAQPTTHLALAMLARGRAEEAERLLRSLLHTSDDPEVRAHLAGVLLKLGKRDEAARLREEAAGRYELLLSAHPRAFASHGARFYLAAGNDAGKAVLFAQRNLAFAATPGAYALLIEALLGAGSKESACAYADRALKEPYPSVRLRVLSARAFSVCGQMQRAEGLIAKISEEASHLLP